jgi:hypothetical protein
MVEFLRTEQSILGIAMWKIPAYKSFFFFFFCGAGDQI